MIGGLHCKTLAVSIGILTLGGALSFAQAGPPGSPPGGAPPPTRPGEMPGQYPNSPPGEQPGQMPELSQSHARDQGFVHQAIEGNLAEIEMGKLALQKSQDPQVRQFGQAMVDDHTKLNSRMEMIAHRLQVPVPDQPSKKARNEMKKMQKMSGAAFDEAYSKAMVKDHKNDLREYQEEATATQDPELRSAVTEGIPVIRRHLTMAEQLVQSQNNTPAASNK